MGVCRTNKGSEQENLKKFAKLFFTADDPRYVGNIFVTIKTDTRDVDGTSHHSMKTVATIPANDKIAEALTKLTFHPNRDYYITPNSFYGSDRQYQHLYQLKNIVIDVDFHILLHGENSKLRDATLKKLTDLVCSPLCADYGLPHPNAVVFTGRGLQFWFRLEDCSAKLVYAYKPAVRYLEACLKDLMCDYIDYIGNALTIDGGASVKPSGLFRLPCTYNSKTKTKSSVEIYHDSPVNVTDLCYKANLRFNNTTTQKTSIPYRGWKGDADELAWFRYRALSALLEKRIAENESILRDEFLFLTYCSLCDSSLDDEHIFDLLREMNGKFPVPMPEDEWKTYLSTAIRKHYHYSNSKIIEELTITEEEQDLVNFYPTDETKRTKGTKPRWKNDATAIEQICKLCKKGMTKKAIAKEIGCSAQTVTRILGKQKLKTKQEKLMQKAWHKALKGASVFNLIALGVSRSYAYALVKHAVEENVKRAEMLEKAKKHKNKSPFDGTISFSKNRRNSFFLQKVLKIPFSQYNCINSLPGGQRATRAGSSSSGIEYSLGWNNIPKGDFVPICDAPKQ